MKQFALQLNNNNNNNIYSEDGFITNKNLCTQYISTIQRHHGDVVLIKKINVNTVKKIS